MLNKSKLCWTNFYLKKKEDSLKTKGSISPPIGTRETVYGYSYNCLTTYFLLF